MDCAKLSSDIKSLKEAKENFESLLDSSEGNFGAIKAREHEVDALCDSVLEEYLGDIVEKNQDIFRYRLGEAICNCGKPVNAFLELNNGDVVVACEDPTASYTNAIVVILHKQEDGSYMRAGCYSTSSIRCMVQADDNTIFYGGDEKGIMKIDEGGSYHIDPFDTLASSDEEMVKMPNGDIIVTHSGEPMIARKNSSNNNFEYESIPTIERNNGETFSAILPLSDSEFLISGSYLALVGKDSDGVYRTYDVMGGTDEYDGLLTLLDNGDVLVVGGEKATEKCDVRILRRNRGVFEPGEQIAMFDDGYPKAAMQLSNGDIVIAIDGPEIDRSFLRILRRKDDGSYDNGKDMTIECSGSGIGGMSYKLRDGRVLCDSHNGELCFLQDDAHPDLEKLKSELSTIILRNRN